MRGIAPSAFQQQCSPVYFPTFYRDSMLHYTLYKTHPYIQKNCNQYGLKVIGNPIVVVLHGNVWFLFRNWIWLEMQCNKLR